MHAVQIDGPILTPEDGLILGNGDLSVSVYQTADRIIWKFGKSDVWDRRLDLADDPKPAHIDEVAKGIRDEGWRCGPYGGPVEAAKGSAHPARMEELCQGAPPSYHERPYPCPKPVGELAMFLPPDQAGLHLKQELSIERALLTISCQWDTGISLSVECFVHPSMNILIVSWELAGWDEAHITGGNLPPVWFALYRWADPTVADFKTRYHGEYRHSIAAVGDSSVVTPLPPPTIGTIGDGLSIEQSFPAETTFPDGFRCIMTAVSPGCHQEVPLTSGAGEARVHILPIVGASAGWIAGCFATSSDADGPDELLAERCTLLTSDEANGYIDQWRYENRKASADFWDQSSFSISDPLLENLWYETLHIRRSTYRSEAWPPGLFLPSTVQDYSHWHGDYHTNYNFQQPFWGDCAANHVELADAFFKAMEHFMQMGRTIARDYYDSRGVFIQLTGYPIHSDEDCLCVVPMGRMAYMTGWIPEHYWMRYRATLDTEWLTNIGYPAIRDCALFYTDFLREGPDHQYHVFPSNQGEDGFTGDVKDYTDRAMVMRYARYCLNVAILASGELNVDDALRATWRHLLDGMAPDEGDVAVSADFYREDRDISCPPHLLAGIGHDGVAIKRSDASEAAVKLLHDRTGWLWRWYCGKLPWVWMTTLRSGVFDPERDMPSIRELIKRWRHPNGLLWAMSVANYGHAGAWTETLGVIAPIQEMMLQSWDGIIRLFPACPARMSAAFADWRADGAFLVSARYTDGIITDVLIKSDAGARCSLEMPWEGEMSIQNLDGMSVVYECEGEEGIARFDTQRGQTYTIFQSLPAAT